MAEETIRNVVYPANAYWFETRADRKLAKHWPSKGKKRAMQSANMDNMNGVITVTDYGRYYNKLKTPDKIYPMLSQVDADRTHFFKTLDRDFADYLALATNGYTSNRVLGKEMDKQLNNLIIREVTHANTRQVADVDSDKAWADLAANDPATTPADYIKMLSAERVISDPKLMASFKTAEELTALGYTVPKGAEPVRYTNDGEALYDITTVYRKNPVKGGKAQAAPSYAIGMDGEINLSNLENVLSAEDVSAFASEFAGKLGVKLQPADIEAGTYTNVSISRARNYGRRIMNYIYKHTGRRPRAMPAGRIAYSQNGTPAEQAYTIAKAIGNHMVQNAILNTEKLIANNPSIENLPDAATFAKYKPVLENAASCLIASQLVAMSGLKNEQAQILANMYKVEAAQSLARLPNLKENKWAMPLVSSYMANGTQLLAGEMRVYTAETRENYINKLGVRNTNVDLINAIMYGKRDFSKSYVQLFGGMYPTATLNDAYDHPVNRKDLRGQLHDHPVNRPDLRGKLHDHPVERKELRGEMHDHPVDDPKLRDEEKIDGEDIIKEIAEEKTDKAIERKWWEIERDYDSLLSSKPKYLESLRVAAKELVLEAIGEMQIKSDKRIMEDTFRGDLFANLDKYCVAGGYEKLNQDIARVEKRTAKNPEAQKLLDKLNATKVLLESTLDLVDETLNYASGGKVTVALNDNNITEIYGYDKSITKNMTGIELFNELTGTYVATAGKNRKSVRTAIKETLQSGLKPVLKELAAGTKVSGDEGKIA